MKIFDKLNGAKMVSVAIKFHVPIIHITFTSWQMAVQKLAAEEVPVGRAP